MDIVSKIKQQIKDNPIILYMKGTPDEPRCGFSARAVTALKNANADFQAIDVLADPEVRQHLPKVSNWPTFPQLFVNGELIGGSDIIWAHYESGELQQILSQVKSV